MSTIKRPIRLDDLEVGEPLPWPVLDQKGRLLLRKGHIITQQRQLEALVERGLYFETYEEPLLPQPVDGLSLYDRLQELKLELASIFRDFHQDEPPKSLQGRVTDLGNELFACSREDTDTLLAALHLDHSDYNLTHPMHIAVLNAAMAAQAGLTAAESRSLIAAALTHDLGIQQYHKELDVQAELNEEQWALIRSHSSRSVEMLRRAGVEDELWLSAVHYHHERLDGSGYPAGLKADAVPRAARIIAICDSYSAMIRERPYRKPIQALDALRDIFLKRGDTIDAELAQLFVKTLGIFPPGALVRLYNGELAVVVRRSSKGSCPIVKSVIAPRGMPYEQPPLRDTNNKEFTVKEMALFSDFPELTRCIPSLLAQDEVLPN